MPLLSRIHFLIAGVTLALGAATAPLAADIPVDANHERQLVQALGAIRAQRLDDARDLLTRLIGENPSFKLAQLIYADLIQARSGPLPRFGAFGQAPADQLADLDAEARVRLAHYLSPPDPERIPQAFIQLDSSVRHAVLVELQRNRLFVFENTSSGVQLTADYYISMGKNGPTKERQGDQRTPVGVYRITSQLSASRLPDFYGSGALPIDYPNEMDRRLGKTGSGIWLHGSPTDTFARPPRASDGCVVLSNPDFTDLGRYVDIPHTPVIITEQAEWVDVNTGARQRDAFLEIIDSWRKSWESLDAERYLDHYARSFEAGGMNYADWAEHKRRVNSTKTFIRVRLTELSMFQYPGMKDVFVANFVQDYSSSNHNSRSCKRQYWQLEQDGRWRIIYEGSA